jgi:sterol desaturase/sphingolipid hydroxylase (fatty acid hydroxylase superfamily)
LLDQIAAELQRRPFTLLVLAGVAWNVVTFTVCIVLGEWIAGALSRHRITPVAPPVTRPESLLAALCVTVNALVAVAGAMLWRGGMIRLHASAPFAVLVDTLVLLFAMDASMYALHRVAHHPLVFRFVHGVHHQYENPRPLTLFVLHPLEVLGFGTLWIIVLTLYHASVLGITCYLTLNLYFGLLGHLGVEPLPAAWLRLPLLRYVSTGTFHAEHHQEREYNFGFYTVIWDRLFGTLDPAYAADFGAAARGADGVASRLTRSG